MKILDTVWKWKIRNRDRLPPKVRRRQTVILTAMVIRPAIAAAAVAAVAAGASSRGSRAVHGHRRTSSRGGAGTGAAVAAIGIARDRGRRREGANRSA